MARRVGELVTVKIRTDAEASATQPAGAPTSFLWRGRLYVVRVVHGRWRERRAWWTSAVARAVHGVAEQGDSDELDDLRGAGGRNDEGEARGVRVLTPGTRVVLDHERTVWRVEASAGRTFGTGVYDLSQGETPETWQLLRVTD
jgi:hypothetical protein